jgi:uncharacterized membrane protein
MPDLSRPYLVLNFVHVVLAIVAVGFNASYGVWLARARHDPEHLGHTLRGVKFLDDWFANPSYVLLLLTGLAMAHFGRIPLTTFWIAASLVLWLVAAGIGVGLYSPALRAQIRAVDAHGPTAPEALRLGRRATVIGILNVVPIVLILVLMVFKVSL